ncbi:MAG: YtkA-like [Pseudomonadota bacterium]|jgi:hypothetical protein
MLLLWMGCAAPDLRTAATTDDGLWRVELVEEAVPLGDAVVALDVFAVEPDAPDMSPTVTVESGMEGMDHGSPVVEATSQGDGRYTAGMVFSMRGAWFLDVTVSAGAERGAARLDLLVE